MLAGRVEDVIRIIASRNPDGGFVDKQPVGNWFWGISFWTTNQISRYTGFDDNKIWFNSPKVG
jgi:hypothetical protein